MSGSFAPFRRTVLQRSQDRLRYLGFDRHFHTDRGQAVGPSAACGICNLLGRSRTSDYPVGCMESTGQPYVFAAKIEKIWIMRVIDIPREVGRAIRKIAGENAKHIPVHGWIEGLAFRNTLVPRGGGNYRMHVHSRIWRKLRIDAGAAVEVTMLLDSEPREVVVPPDLAGELADTPRALASFNQLTAALRRHIIQFVEAAKQSRTREKRIQLMVKRMLERDARRTKRLAKTKKAETKKRKGR